MIDNGLSAKAFMEEFASRSKKIFNPTIPVEGSSLYGIKVVTDVDYSTTDIITFLINGLVADSSSKEILSTVGFVNLTDENKFCAANLATSRIIKAGADSESNKLILYFIHDNVYESVELNKVGIEIFAQQDNKNHAVEVSYLTEEEYESIESELEPITEGEIDSHFSFSINTGENIIHITNGSDIVEPIDYIANAKNADSLNNDISISVNSGVSNPQITGSGSIDGGDLTGNLNLSVNTQPIVQDVLNNLLIPVASSTTLGGINIAGNAYTFTDPEYPVKLKNVNNKNYAYVDLTDFAELQQQDIHRYTNMNDATVDHPNLGEIVQYIGNTTASYTHGYFYMRVRELIQGLLAANTNWHLTSPATGLATLNAAITEYNKLSDHLLVMSQTLTLAPVDSTITSNTIDDNTVFNVVNGNFTDTLTYADIKLWGIELSTLTYDDQHPELFVATITLSYIDESNPPVWILKNVLPPINVPAALVYKGICTWAELEAKTLISKPGDFYTVSDKSNQEYFFNGTITSNWEDSWEYMGQVFTQLQADWTQNNSSAVDYIKNKPTIPAAQIQSDWNQTDNTSLDFIKNKPSLATVATSGAYSDLSGTPTLATVATSGSYTDLSNTPTIPAAQVNSDWNASSGVAEILHKPTITDEKVKVKSSSNNSTYPVLTCDVGSPANNTTHEAIFHQGLRVNPAKKSVQEGNSTLAMGECSHAEGYSLVSSPFNSTYSTTNSLNLLKSEPYNGQPLDEELNAWLTPGSIIYIDELGEYAKVTSATSVEDPNPEDPDLAYNLYITLESNLSDSISDSNITAVYAASGNYSHTEGEHTSAFGVASHAGGSNTIADQNYMTAIGTYNEVGDSTALFVIGDGYFDSGSRLEYRRNAFKVTNDGKAVVRDSITAGSFIKSGGISSLFLKADGSVDSNTYSTTSHTHSLSLATDSGTSSISLAANTKYKLTAGGSTYIFTTPADSDTTYTFAEGSTDGAFSVTPSGGSASSVAVHNVLKTSGGTLTGQVYYNESGTVTSTVTCERKYNWLNISSDTTLSITMPSSLDGPCEVIYAVKNTGNSDVVLTLPSSSNTVHNMIGLSAFTIGAGKIAELVFTFWSTTDVSFNGGVE